MVCYLLVDLSRRADKLLNEYNRHGTYFASQNATAVDDRCKIWRIFEINTRYDRHNLLEITARLFLQLFSALTKQKMSQEQEMQTCLERSERVLCSECHEWLDAVAMADKKIRGKFRSECAKRYRCSRPLRVQIKQTPQETPKQAETPQPTPQSQYSLSLRKRSNVVEYKVPGSNEFHGTRHVIPSGNLTVNLFSSSKELSRSLVSDLTKASEPQAECTEKMSQNKNQEINDNICEKIPKKLKSDPEKILTKIKTSRVQNILKSSDDILERNSGSRNKASEVEKNPKAQINQDKDTEPQDNKQQTSKVSTDKIDESSSDNYVNSKPKDLLSTENLEPRTSKNRKRLMLEQTNQDLMAQYKTLERQNKRLQKLLRRAEQKLQSVPKTSQSLEFAPTPSRVEPKASVSPDVPTPKRTKLSIGQATPSPETVSKSSPVNKGPFNDTPPRGDNTCDLAAVTPLANTNYFRGPKKAAKDQKFRFVSVDEHLELSKLPPKKRYLYKHQI